MGSCQSQCYVLDRRDSKLAKLSLTLQHQLSSQVV
nr:MAG TPA: hypothetical protein [Caudoviricetes sp.]